MVFTGDLNYTVRKGIVSVDRRLPDLSWLVLVHAPHRSLRKTLRVQWRNLRREGWRRIRDIAFTLRDRIRVRSNLPLPAGAPGTEYAVGHLEGMKNVQILRYKNIQSPAAVRAVAAFAPDLGLSLAAPILKKRLFTIPALGTLNLHKGKLPDYRGMPPAFWELWNGETSVGCTVHWVEEQLDAGAVAVSSAIACQKYSTLKALQLGLDELGHELVCRAVSEINQGAALRTPQGDGGVTNRKPTLRQMDELNRRRRQICDANGGQPKRMVKDLVKKPAVALGRSVLRHFVSPRIVVLLYHRVSDDARDNLTTGVEQFDRQMQLLRRYFEIIPLDALLRLQEIPRSNRPLVSVTFDDGYLDNYVNAFPILQKNHVPAAFFVSTGLIGTDRQFPHDIRRGNKPIPMMEWAHLVEMHGAGFTIGSHTVSHINCAKAEEGRVRAELADSLDEIRSRLGANEVAFAYPYGGGNDMTKERLELVKEIGYSACLSAYGGNNVGRIDRFNVVRRGVHWEFSDASFLWAALGLV